MWIIALLACLCVTLDCKAQEVTSTDAYTVTETSGVNKDVDWDITRAPVTLSIRDGRSNLANRQRNYGTDEGLSYSNQWRPILMPITFNPFRDNNPQRTARVNVEDKPFVPTFLRRPDSDLNYTLPFVDYPYPSHVGNNYPYLFPNQFGPSFPPGNPYAFHPQIINDNLRSNSEIYVARNVQNTSDAPLQPAVTETVTQNYDNEQMRTLTTQHFPATPLEAHGGLPVTNFRNVPDDYPHLPPLYYAPTFPVLPDRRDELHPLNNQNYDVLQYDREVGSEVIEKESPLKPASNVEMKNPSEDVQESIGTPLGAIPSNNPPYVSSRIPPPGSLSLPIGYPFGVLPPPVFSPSLPITTFPRVLPVNTPLLPGDLNVARGNAETSGLETTLQANDRLPLETNPEALPSANALPSGPDIVTELPAPDEIITGENVNAPKLPYEFGFDMNDGKGTDQHRQEISDGSGVVTGSYGYRDVFGVYRLVNYIADKNGFRAFIKSNEPGVASSGSADVIVMAEHPPAPAIAEGLKASGPQAVVVPDETPDLIAQGSESGIL